MKCKGSDQNAPVILETWSDRFIRRFKLDVETPSIRIERLPKNCDGRFRPGRHPTQSTDEIAINSQHLILPLWKVLGLLLHLHLHQWQHHHGKPGRRNYHNQEFRNKAAEFGLRVSQDGTTEYSDDGSFLKLLRKHRVDASLNAPPLLKAAVQPARTKMHKWSCGCSNVRVAISDFQARCLKCGKNFKPHR